MNEVILLKPSPLGIHYVFTYTVSAVLLEEYYKQVVITRRNKLLQFTDIASFAFCNSDSRVIKYLTFPERLAMYFQYSLHFKRALSYQYKETHNLTFANKDRLYFILLKLRYLISKDIRLGDEYRFLSFLLSPPDQTRQEQFCAVFLNLFHLKLHGGNLENHSFYYLQTMCSDILYRLITFTTQEYSDYLDILSDRLDANLDSL